MRPAENCRNPVDVSTPGQGPGTEYVCGCTACPEPDPTPAELQAKVDRAWWATQREAAASEV